MRIEINQIILIVNFSISVFLNLPLIYFFFLFRALKTKSNTPKYGLLFHSSFIGRAGTANKGRISRFLANKCAIASRLDSFSGNIFILIRLPKILPFSSWNFYSGNTFCWLLISALLCKILRKQLDQCKSGKASKHLRFGLTTVQSGSLEVWQKFQYSFWIQLGGKVIKLPRYQSQLSFQGFKKYLEQIRKKKTNGLFVIQAIKVDRIIKKMLTGICAVRSIFFKYELFYGSQSYAQPPLSGWFISYKETKHIF